MVFSVRGWGLNSETQSLPSSLCCSTESTKPCHSITQQRVVGRADGLRVARRPLSTAERPEGLVATCPRSPDLMLWFGRTGKPVHGPLLLCLCYRRPEPAISLVTENAAELGLLPTGEHG